jgi:hypothetical protein
MYMQVIFRYSAFFVEQLFENDWTDLTCPRRLKLKQWILGIVHLLIDINIYSFKYFILGMTSLNTRVIFHTNEFWLYSIYIVSM